MSDTETPAKMLRATLGPKIIRNIDRYFTNSVDAIATELLQNARRAGARRVTVTVTRDAVTVADDGRGLPAEDAGTLLAFGGSGNDGVTELDESPAGMGFFSLARRGARVRSRDWAVTFTPANFVGEAEAMVTEGFEAIEGMVVTFPIEVGDPVHDAFWHRAETMPFETVIDGHPVARFAPEDRLHDRDGAPLYDSLVGRDIGDCSVTVARFLSGSAMWYRRPFFGPPDATPPHVLIVADVFGQVVPTTGAFPDVEREQGFPEGDVLSRAPGMRGEDGQPSGPWIASKPVYLVILRSIGSATLVPRLPDRQTLVRTAGLAEIAAALPGLIAEAMAASSANAMGATSPLHRLARLAGRTIPPRQIVIERPLPEGSTAGRDVVATSGEGMTRAMWEALAPKGERPLVVLNPCASLTWLLGTIAGEAGYPGDGRSVLMVRGDIIALPRRPSSIAIADEDGTIVQAVVNGYGTFLPYASRAWRHGRKCKRITVTMGDDHGEVAFGVPYAVISTESMREMFAVTAPLDQGRVIRALMALGEDASRWPDLHNHRIDIVWRAMMSRARGATHAIMSTLRRTMTDEVETVTATRTVQRGKPAVRVVVTMVDGKSAKLTKPLLTEDDEGFFEDD